MTLPTTTAPVSKLGDLYIAKRDRRSNRWGVVSVNAPTTWVVEPEYIHADASRKAVRLNLDMGRASILRVPKYAGR